MVNVGLRGFIWEQKPIEQKLYREQWAINGCSYAAYREYIEFCKDNGFPDQRASRASSRRSTTDGSVAARPEKSQASASSAATSTGLAGTTSAGFQFAGVQHLEACSGQRATIILFSRLDSPLLAFGTVDGAVQVVSMEAEPLRVQHILSGHERAVNDLDWSLDNSFLLSVGLCGSVCLWQAASGRLLRTLRTRSLAVCARLHMVNQNLIMVGTDHGYVEVLNSSTGKRVAHAALYGAGGLPGSTACCAMAASNSLLFVADSRGCITTLRCDMKAGVLQRLVTVSRTQAASSRPAKAVSLTHSPYTNLAKGASLLLSSTDGAVTVFRIPDVQTSRLERVASALMPPAARDMRAALCPPLRQNAAELVAMGCEDTSVATYQLLAGGGPPPVVNRLQMHLAPVVDISWSAQGTILASCDCDGVVIIWRRSMPREMF